MGNARDEDSPAISEAATPLGSADFLRRAMKRSSPTEGSEEVLESEFSISMALPSTRSLLGRHMDAGVIVLGYVLRYIYYQYNEETADEL